MANSAFVTSLRCLRCDSDYPPNATLYVCPHHDNIGSNMGYLDVRYDYAAIAQRISPRTLLADADRSIGRYHPLLPLADRNSLPALAVGDTPLTHARRLGERIGLPQLYLKDDGRNPSASFKDRASALAVALAGEGGWSVIATASTGNAAAALAGQSAAAGQPNVIFVPHNAPQAKIAQLLIYGSTVLAVNGSYDQAFDLCMEACAEFGWYNRNTGYNPYMTEGKKTVAYELGEQLASLTDAEGTMVVPDAVFVSVGDDCIIGGVHKGFVDMLALGWIERLPRIYGVQSTRSSAIANAWRAGLEIPEPVAAHTRADSINVNAPRDPVKALNAVRRSNGAFVTVTDDAILAAMLPLASQGAVFAEPAGAAAYAGLLQALEERLVNRRERIVVINTGSGLKDIQAVVGASSGPTLIEPTLSAVRQALGNSPLAGDG